MEKLTDHQAELYDSLFCELRKMYQNGQAWADNGIPFRQQIEDFVQDAYGQNIKIDGNGWYCYTCATTFARPGDCPICLGKLCEPQPPAPDAALLEAAKDAITALEHIPPSGCWSTGPLTGDAIEDHVVCPGCRAISKLRAAIAQAEAKAGGK